MTLARLSDLLVSAAASGTGLGAFNVFSIERAEALTAAADVANSRRPADLSECRALTRSTGTYRTRHSHIGGA